MPKQKEPVKRKQSGVRLHPESIKKLKHLAIDLDKSFNSLIEEAIEDLLKKYHSKK
ncbi:ribbon-helix-helix protein, CopG family [candidate division WS5 bacterium]|uniref:Ribbon-helix-helix protein, CopG family n=1 Tax=candidate division WS5 bacterium TaxID=2093353 RepID=A0A419D9W5_9BACT|nr:MAG: ribbon-helix-helix protein, CopG family [candidate division WS5 bacterium]